MRAFGAYAVAVGIVLSVLCCANPALASDLTTPSATIGKAPVGNDLSLIDIGGFLRQVGGFIRVGITTLISVSSGGGLGPTQPANLVATPVSSSEIDLSWSPSSGSIGVAGYQIFRDGVQVASDTSGTTYNDTGLSPSTLHTYWVAAYDTAENVSTTSAAVSAVTNTGPDQYGTTWHDLKIGGGGFIRGIDIAPDGTKVIRTDTYGAYLWTGTQWQQLVSTSSMPAGDVTVDNNQGVYEIRIAPSNTNRFYMEYNGYVYRSDNKGATWTKTAFPQATADPNDGYAQDGEKMAIDPANADVVYVGTESTGLWVSSDAGASWTNVTSVPSSSEGMMGIAFDPSSGTTGGKTNTIYVGSFGNGVYRSTNAGSTWTLLSGGPTSVTNAVVASSTYFAVDDTNAWEYSGGTWTEINAGGGWHSIAVDPANSAHIVLADAGGTIDVSTNGGATWAGGNAGTRVATDVPWLAWTNENYMTNGNMVFDPSASNKLYFAEGIGVWYANPPSTLTSFNWNSQTLGIEQLVSNEVISPPGGVPIVASWDRPIFRISNPDVYPSTQAPNNTYSIIMGWSLDYASNDPSYIVGLINWNGAEESGYSTDGGQTWNPFSSYPAGDSTGGSIAAASSTDIVWVPENNSNPYYTTDGGATWTQIDAPGAPTSGTTGWGWVYYLDRQIVAADRVNIGTFYMYNYIEGFYRSTDGGATWTLTHSGEITGGSSYNAELEAAPNEAGDLFFTGGPQSPGPHPVSEAFEHSTDGGTTWTAVPNVLEVRTFGFGAPAAGTTTPSLYIVGWVNNIYGVWRSTDNAVSWTQIGSWPLNSIDDIKTISGDMNTYGRVYIGFVGSGYAYGDTSDAAPSVTFANPSAGATLDGSSVTLTATTSGSVAIANVKFEVDGTNIGSAITSPPYTITWNSTGVADGTHTLYTVSEGTSGKYATSSVSVTVDNNTPPSIPTNLNAIEASSTQINLSWTASTGPLGVAGYEIFRGGSQIGTSTNTAYADSGLTASTTYTYVVKAFDSLGNVSGSSAPATATTTVGGGYDPATNAWASAVNTAGGSVSATQESYVNTLITCYKSAGIFSLMDREWLLWSDNVQQAQIDIIKDQSWTSHGTSGFTADAGYTGDFSTSYLDTNFVPSTAGGNYSQNSASMDVYVTSNQTHGNGADVGVQGGSYAEIQPYAGGNTSDFELNGHVFFSGTNTSPQGLWSMFRTNSSTTTVYRNGAPFTSAADPSDSLPDESIFIGAQDQEGTAGNFSIDTLAMVGIGGGLTGTQEAAKAACDDAYAASKGFNVF